MSEFARSRRLTKENVRGLCYYGKCTWPRREKNVWAVQICMAESIGGTCSIEKLLKNVRGFSVHKKAQLIIQ